MLIPKQPIARAVEQKYLSDRHPSVVIKQRIRPRIYKDFPFLSLSQTTMKTTFQLSFLLLSPFIAAFHLEPVRPGRTTTNLYTSMPMKDRNEGRIMYPKQNFPVKKLDMERAKDCAEHVGKCSVQELTELRDGLHQKHIQEVIFGDHDVTNPSGSTAPEDIFQERVLEDELNLQLNLLHDEMPPAYLFTPTEHPFQETDDTGTAAALAAKVKEAEQTHVLLELEEDGALESLAICALISVLMIAPQFIMN